MELSETERADEIAEAIAIWIWDDGATELVVNSAIRLLIKVHIVIGMAVPNFTRFITTSVVNFLTLVFSKKKRLVNSS
jgi:hypothetical protein